MVDDKGEPCIADFGLSQVQGESLTWPGAGSRRWMAPELVAPEPYGGNGERTTASDIYAFGMTCLEVGPESALKTRDSV